MSITIEGYCVGVNNETREYVSEGQMKTYEVRTASFIDLSGRGEPDVVDIPEKYLSSFKLFSAYKFPVTVSARVSRNGGAISRLRLPDTATITPLAAQGAAGGK